MGGEGFPGGASDKELACPYRRHKRCRFDPWIGKIRWKRAWQPTSSILPWRIPWVEEHGRLQSIRSQRVRYNWSNFAHSHCIYYGPNIFSWMSKYLDFDSITLSFPFHHLFFSLFSTQENIPHCSLNISITKGSGLSSYRQFHLVFYYSACWRPMHVPGLRTI